MVFSKISLTESKTLGTVSYITSESALDMRESGDTYN